MNRIEHLLTIATEECAEVQQAATKAMRFGLEEGKDCSAFEHGSNVERLRYELNDLIAVVEMLESEGLNLSPDYESRKAKKEKVERYLLHSKECGTLSS